MRLGQKVLDESLWQTIQWKKYKSHEAFSKLMKTKGLGLHLINNSIIN